MGWKMPATAQKSKKIPPHKVQKRLYIKLLNQPVVIYLTSVVKVKERVHITMNIQPLFL